MSALYLQASTDKVRVTTSTAAAIKIHGNYIISNMTTGDFAGQGNFKFAVSAATDTDILAGPGGSTNFYIPKEFTIYNADGSLSCDVTVSFNDNGTPYPKYKVTLQPGEMLSYNEATGFFKYTLLGPRSGLKNVAIADQSIGASTTAYVTGSAILLPSPVPVGLVLRWTIQLGKTAAATAQETLAIRFGTGGSTSDTARCSATLDTETAAADEAVDIITATIRANGATAVVQSSFKRDDNLSTTGFSTTARKAQIQQIQSSSFDITPAGTYAGISIQTGASHALTVRQCQAELLYTGG